ncbi:hypothetical protein [Streptomyces sp. NPDC056663]
MNLLSNTLAEYLGDLAAALTLAAVAWAQRKVRERRDGPDHDAPA